MATTLLSTVGDNPGRVRTEAAFAPMCGVSPVDASSGLQARQPLNWGGCRQANSALSRVVITHDDPRCGITQAPHQRGEVQTGNRALPKALWGPESSIKPS